MIWFAMEPVVARDPAAALAAALDTKLPKILHFTARRIAALEPVVREVVADLLADLPAEGEGDIIERFAWPLPLRVLGHLLGLPRSDLAQLHRWGNDWILVQQEGPLFAVGSAYLFLQQYEAANAIWDTLAQFPVDAEMKRSVVLKKVEATNHE